MSARIWRLLVVLVLFSLAGCTASKPAATPAAAGWHGTRPNTADAFHFAILSDRTGGHVPGDFEKAIGEINLLQPDFVICVGDLIEGYNDDEATITTQWKELEQMISRLDAPFYYCPGNHDVEADQGHPAITRKLYTQRHAINGKTYYSFNYNKAHFIVLDSKGMLETDSFANQQFAWLRQDIDSARDAQQVFVFYHHPIWENTKLWPTLAQILPKDKTTIFNGHWHSMDHVVADGISTYVLPSTAAHVNADDPAAQHMFAYVSSDGSQTRIALVPTGQLKPSSYPSLLKVAISNVAGGGLAEMPAEGGDIPLHYANTAGTQAMIAEATLLAPDGALAGKVRYEMSPGDAAQLKFTFALPPNGNASPVLTETFTFAGQSMTRQTKLPISPKAQLGNLAPFTPDGKLEKWTAIAPMQVDKPSNLFQNGNLWRGPSDSSCKLRAAIAGDKLALLIEATDDQINTGKEQPWEQDAIELCWDIRAERKAGMTEGTGWIGIVPGDHDGPAKSIAWVPAGKSAMTPQAIQSFSHRTANGYLIELTIPLADLGLAGGTAKSGLVRLAICQDDLDLSAGKETVKRLSSTSNGDFWRGTQGYARFTSKP